MLVFTCTLILLALWISGIGVSFSTCGFLTLSTTFLYLVCTLSQKVCNDFSPPDYVFLKNTIDNQNLWNGSTFATLALAGKFEGDLVINITDVLRCHGIFFSGICYIIVLCLQSLC